MKTNDIKLELSNWKFQIDQEDVGESFGWHLPEHDKSAWLDVVAPGAWDFYEIALRNYEGVGWYYTETPAFNRENNQYILEFTGVGGRAWVWVNGQLAGYNGIRYLPFSVNIQKYLNTGGNNTIVVKVNNCFQGEKHLTGGKKIEWVLYGGLIHQVYLVKAHPFRIEHMNVKADCSGKADVTVTIRNDGSHVFSGKLRLSLDTDPVCETEASVQCGPGRQTNVSFNLESQSFIAWSHHRPVLYTLSAVLFSKEKEWGSASVRIGFRTIECKGTKILLNGEPIFFKGVNRYDEYHPYGSSVPEQLIRQDLWHIKQCGVNLIRVHYPQDPVHLDIADEIGLLYMLEVPLNWWNAEDKGSQEDFPDLEAEAIEVMDRTYKIFGNHPSWVIWSMSNECEYRNKAGIGMMRMLAEKANTMHCGRLITIAICNMPKDRELDFCDFVGINRYYGINNPVQKLTELEQYIVEPIQKDLAMLAELYPEKPIVICEFGAISIRGLRGEARMSEDRHGELLKYTFKAMIENKNVCGAILWAWADYFHNLHFYSTDPGSIHINTAFGPYGVMTVDRRIKDRVYKTFLEIFSSELK